MALLRKLFYRKPPDGLFEICERVYGAFLLHFRFSLIFSFSVFLCRNDNCIVEYFMYSPVWEWLHCVLD